MEKLREIINIIAFTYLWLEKRLPSDFVKLTKTTGSWRTTWMITRFNLSLFRNFLKISFKCLPNLLKMLFSLKTFSKGGLKGVRPPSPSFCNQLFFAITLKNYILCLLKLNWSSIMHLWHLLFGRQLLSYSKTTSAVIRNLTVLSTTTDKINRIRNHFWNKWRR